MDTIYEGKRLSFNGELCTIHYSGPVEGTKGVWLGVEWDDTSRGKHDGAVNGARYFKCTSASPTAASFVRPNRPNDAPVSFVSALHGKYASNIDLSRPFSISADRNEPTAVRISGKEVEEVGFQKIRIQQANLRELRIVLLDTLCVSRPNARSGSFKEDDGNDDVAETCPKVTELDLSRNLFEEWSEIVDITRQLHRLQSLRINGNRFRSLALPVKLSGFLTTTPFTKITNLSLDDTLLPWEEVARIALSFPSLLSLSASSNEYTTLTPQALPPTLQKLTLENNSFTSLAAIAPLSQQTSLIQLNLKENNISAISPPSASPSTLQTFPSITDLDLSSNALPALQLFDSIPQLFPSLVSLRVSNNPLYNSLTSASGTPLTPDDGYMLTLARLANLQRLNYSQITPRERLNAETYYLSQITAELSAASEEDADTVLRRHKRYNELVAKYGEREVKRTAPQKSGKPDPGSLAARLAAVEFMVEEAVAQASRSGFEGKVLRLRVPKSLSVYAVLGLVGRAVGVDGMLLELVWETGEKAVVADEELLLGGEGFGGNVLVEDAMGRKMREEVLVPRIRPLGSWVGEEDGDVRVRVRWSEIEVKRREDYVRKVKQEI